MDNDLGRSPAEPATQSQAEPLVPSAGWQSFDTAPLDGTEIQARIPGHGEDNVIAFAYAGGGFYAWSFTREQEPPDCWSDGYCWSVNEDGKMSVQPTHWKPLP